MLTPPRRAIGWLVAIAVLAPVGAAAIPQPAHAARGEAVYARETLTADAGRTTCEKSPVALTITPAASGGWDIVLVRAPSAEGSACQSPLVATWTNVASGSPDRGFNVRASGKDACEASALDLGPAGSLTPFRWESRRACGEDPRIETLHGVLEFETYSILVEGVPA